jgi:hypothetical protein
VEKGICYLSDQRKTCPTFLQKCTGETVGYSPLLQGFDMVIYDSERKGVSSLQASKYKTNESIHHHVQWKDVELWI